MFTPGFWRIKRFADTVPEMLHLQREMNRLFADAGRAVTQDYPMINIWEKNDSILVTAEVPGMEPEKMDVAVSGDLLTIAGAVQAEVLKADEVYLRLMALEPRFPEAWYNYGKLQLARNHRDEARRCFAKALELPFNALSTVTKGEVERAYLAVN